MTYFQYIKKNTRPFMIVVVVLFILFYIAGFWFAEVDSMVEGKYLLLILGIPAVLFFGVNYFKWRKLNQRNDARHPID